MATKITIEATVNAPIDRVWAYWNEPEHIKNWSLRIRRLALPGIRRRPACGRQILVDHGGEGWQFPALILGDIR